jgi:hypothetical protein
MDRRHRGFFGDTARVARLPGTFNFSKKRWCIALKEDEIKKPYYWHSNLATNKRMPEYHFIGSKILDLEKYIPEVRTEVKKMKLDMKGDLGVVDKILSNTNNLYDCVRRILIGKKKYWDRDSGWIDRRIIITYCREKLGLTENQTAYFMKKILTEAEYYHMLDEVPSRRYGQVSYIYDRENLFFPNMETMRVLGYCNECGKCRRNGHVLRKHESAVQLRK